MKADLTKNGTELLIDIDGRLDTDTAPELAEKVKTIDDDIEAVIFDFDDLEYISSAGLRVLFIVLKSPGPKKKVIIKNAKDSIKEILSATGLDEIMEIE